MGCEMENEIEVFVYKEDKNVFVYMCDQENLEQNINSVKRYCVDNYYNFDEDNIFINNLKELKKHIHPGDVLILGELSVLGNNIDEIKRELFSFTENDITLVILRISKALNEYLNNKNELILDELELLEKLLYLDMQDTAIEYIKTECPKVEFTDNLVEEYEESLNRGINKESIQFNKKLKPINIINKRIYNKSEVNGELRRFTYPNNAVIKCFNVYLTDSTGNKISSKHILKIGSRITVLSIDFETQLVSIEYLSENRVKKGFIKNDYRTIEYLNCNNYINGYMCAQVYKENDKFEKYGVLSPYEKATILYKENSKFCIVYDTSKGSNSKTGFILPAKSKKKFTHANNAVIHNFKVALRDERGKRVSNKVFLNVGKRITVLWINFEKQLALIEYLFNNEIRVGYIKNSTRTIKYLNEHAYENINKITLTYAIYNGKKQYIGSLFPNEKFTILYKDRFGTYIIYDTKQGKNSKSAFIDLGF